MRPPRADKEKIQPKARLPPGVHLLGSHQSGGPDYQYQDEQAEFHHRHPAHRHEDGHYAFQAAQDQPAEKGAQGVAPDPPKTQMTKDFNW